MSFRAKVLGLIEVALRVPPLFVIDEILKIGVNLHLNDNDLNSYHNRYSNNEGDYEQLFKSHPTFEDEIRNYTSTFLHNPAMYRITFSWLFRFLLSAIGCASALCMFVLNTKHLIVVYMYLMSVGMVFVSYWTNVKTIKVITSLEDTLNYSFRPVPPPSIFQDFLTTDLSDIFSTFYNSHLLQNYILQIFLSIIFVNLHLGPRYPLLQKLLPCTFLAPSILSLLPLPATVMHNIPIFAALLPLALVKFVLWSSTISIYQTMRNGYLHSKTYVDNFGVSALIEAEWSRLNVPEVLRTFWTLRMLEHVVVFFMAGHWDQPEAGHTPHFHLLKYVLVTGCDTLVAVLGITSIVSFICSYIGKFFQWLLLTDDDNDKNFGTVSAIVFYILALQTGLTSLEPNTRFIRLCRNFCLLFTAILHFVHNVVNPLLMSLSASHNPSIKRHAHALMVCACLILLPSLLMYYLWMFQTITTWLLAVTAFSVEVIVKVCVSLSIYGLFLWDARRETFWEPLDDYIYYVRSFGSTVEFCFGIFLFFNGAWILAFESGSVIRAVMMCIHAYFNIWCDAKAGWSVFIKRRTAVNKIESLPEADDAQLRQLDDVCAICYQEMKSAKITKCRHFFHGVCLRKWLYVQDRCPLCHEILHAMDVGPSQQRQRQYRPHNDHNALYPQPLIDGDR